MPKLAETSARVGLTVNKELLARVDEYAEKMGISRSAAFSVLASQALDGQRGIDALNKIAEMADQMQMQL